MVWLCAQDHGIPSSKSGIRRSFEKIYVLNASTYSSLGFSVSSCLIIIMRIMITSRGNLTFSLYVYFSITPIPKTLVLILAIRRFPACVRISSPSSLFSVLSSLPPFVRTYTRVRSNFSFLANWRPSFFPYYFPSFLFFCVCPFFDIAM